MLNSKWFQDFLTGVVSISVLVLILHGILFFFGLPSNQVLQELLLVAMILLSAATVSTISWAIEAKFKNNPSLYFTVSLSKQDAHKLDDEFLESAIKHELERRGIDDEHVHTLKH